MATTIISGNSQGKKRHYTLTVEATTRTSTSVNLYFTLTMKYLTNRTTSTKRGAYLDIQMPKIYKEDAGVYTIWFDEYSFNSGDTRTFSFSISVNTSSSGSYYIPLGKMDIQYYWYASGGYNGDSDYDTTYKDRGQIWIPAYYTPITPTPVPTPTPTPTYNITASATSTLNTGTITLYGLPYKSCTIDWYLNGIIKDSSTFNGSLGSTSHTFTGLVPSTKYTLKGVVKANGTTLGAASADTTTGNETGELTLSATSRSITADLTGMSAEPKYTRTVLFEIYDESTGYSNSALVTGANDTELQCLFQGLQINTDYTVTATIKNGGINLKTLSKQARTGNDYELLPTANIVSVKQKKGSTDIVLTWNIDKTAAQTEYKIEVKREGGTFQVVKTLNTYTNPVEIPITLEEGSAGEDVDVRIRTKNTFLAGDETTLSEPVTFHIIGDYAFTTEKEAGNPIVISAEEWNRLIDYTKNKSRNYGLSFDLPYVTAGDKITAKAYNSLKNAINSMRGINIQDKKAGNPISAADINALRTAINLA